MKNLLVIFLSVAFAAQISAQQLRKAENQAWKRGEKLTFRVFYDAILTGEVNAGIATLEVTDENKQINGRNTYRIVGKGGTQGAFNLFFRVVDRYETIMDEEALVPWVFIRRVNEGGYKIEQDVTFNQMKNMAKTNNNPYKAVPDDIQDVISALYYARTLDLTNLKENEEISIPFFLDDTLYTSKIIFEGREEITTKLGTFRCLKFKPMVAIGSIFKDPYPMTLYVTDDKNRLPILATSGILVGNVKMELMKVSGIRNPLTSLVKK